MKLNIGTYNFNLIQGDTYTFELYFFVEENGIETPENLLEYEDIIWAFRTENNINLAPFEVKSLSNGDLEITGDDNNVLKISFDRELYSTQLKTFYHSCLFVKENERTTRLAGLLNNFLNTVSDTDVAPNS